MRRLLSAGALLALLLAVPAVPFPYTANAQEELSNKERQRLEDQLDELQQEIDEWQTVLDETRAKKNTLQGDVSALNAQIAQAEAQIKQKNIAIGNLGTEIKQKTSHINELVGKIDEGHESLASLMRRQNQIDDLTMVEIAFAADNAFTLFEDVDQMASVQVGLHQEFAQIRSAKAETESQRAELAKKQNAEVDARHVVETKKAEVAENEAAKQQLLAITKNEEAQYQQVLAERQAEAASIRARLFPLRDAAAIKFGDAVAYAQKAQDKTGVRPALILAILTQESNLGQNVGQCYMTDDDTGDGVGKNTGTPFAGVMSPTRDVPPFLDLAKRLGFDPHQQVVSCPIAGVGGWGGAMGPAQFIPSTWVGLANRIGASANPWDPQDAIMAMAIYLSDLGASAGGYTAEYTAAARYYAGWNGPNTNAGRNYGLQVMNRVESIQQDIDFLDEN